MRRGNAGSGILDILLFTLSQPVLDLQDKIPAAKRCMWHRMHMAQEILGSTHISHCL